MYLFFYLFIYVLTAQRSGPIQRQYSNDEYYDDDEDDDGNGDNDCSPY